MTKTWWHELCWQTAVYLGNHKTYQKPLCCFKNVIPQCDVFTFTTTTLTTHIDLIETQYVQIIGPQMRSYMQGLLEEGWFGRMLR